MTVPSNVPSAGRATGTWPSVPSSEDLPPAARAAVAAGADGVFMEVHPEPDKALCDGPNSLKLDDVPELLTTLKALRQISNRMV